MIYHDFLASCVSSYQDPWPATLSGTFEQYYWAAPLSSCFMSGRCGASVARSGCMAPGPGDLEAAWVMPCASTRTSAELCWTWLVWFRLASRSRSRSSGCCCMQSSFLASRSRSRAQFNSGRAREFRRLWLSVICTFVSAQCNEVINASGRSYEWPHSFKREIL